MGPLEVAYSIPAVILAAMVVGLTQLTKTLLDLWFGIRTPNLVPGTALAAGKADRQDRVFLNRLILPAIPVLWGVLLAVAIPFRPEAVTEFVTAQVPQKWATYVIFGMWGATVGQFADYIYTRLKELIREFTR